MRIDVRKCNAEKKYAGDLEWEEEGDNGFIDIPYVSFSSPVKVRAHYEILEDDSVEVEAEISFRLKGLCSRCLNETEQSFSAKAEGCYSTVEGEEDYFYRNGVVDLSEFLRDAVLDALPPRLLCGGDCVPPTYEK